MSLKLFEGWSCRPRINLPIVVASGDCLSLAMAVKGGRVGVDDRVLEAAAASFEKGSLAPIQGLPSRQERAAAAALVYGGIVLLSECPGDVVAVISRLYTPELRFTLRSRTGASAGGRVSSDRALVEAVSLIASGRISEALEALRGPIEYPSGLEIAVGSEASVAPAGIECVPPYFEGGT